MFDIGWVEMMIVVVVMIVVIGPKDLPVVLHTMGKWIAHVRAMARGFQDSIEEMAQESGLDQMREDVRSISDFSLEDEIEKAVDPEGELIEGISGNPAKAIESEKESADGNDRAGPGNTDEGTSAGVTPELESEPEPGTPARGEKT
jgi:sec-independent protein translocase protein TatB